MSAPQEEINSVCIYWFIDFYFPAHNEWGESAAHRSINIDTLIS